MQRHLRTHDVGHWARFVPRRARACPTRRPSVNARPIDDVRSAMATGAVIDPELRVARDRPDRPGAAAAGRLRLRRHAGADRGGPDPGRTRCRRRWRRSAPWPRCRRPPWRWSPGGRCATWPRCPGCPARCTWSAATAPSSTSASSSGSTPELVEVRTRLQVALRDIVAGKPGVRLENKPASVAVHTARRERPVADEVSEAVRTGPATWPEVTVDPRQGGRSSCRWSPPTRAPRSTSSAPQMSASAVLFIGDDVTDENAFANLHGPDVGVKIGPGETRAGYRVGEPIEAARVLGAAAGDAGGTGCSASGRCRSSGTRCSPTARRSRCSPRRPRSPGCATRGRTRRRSSPTCSAAARPATSRSPPERGGTAAGPALPARHDDGGDPLVRADRHRLARPRTDRRRGRESRRSRATRPWSGG